MCWLLVYSSESGSEKFKILFLFAGGFIGDGDLVRILDWGYSRLWSIVVPDIGVFWSFEVEAASTWGVRGCELDLDFVSTFFLVEAGYQCFFG